ncbi:MAG: glycosyltransferase [Clostridia bacterium]|nr:glycosyltransferase [Clostridia bacterium]
MHVIHVYSGCSPQKFYEYVESKGQRIQQQAQKYNQLLLEGFKSCGAQVDAISSRPINRSLTSQIFFKGETDSYQGIRYHYVPFFNLPVLRNISVLFSVFFRVMFMKTNRNDTALVCDALNISGAMATLMAGKLRRMKTVGVVTDVPCHRPNNQKIPVHERINLQIMQKFDLYLLLTEQMSAVVNPKNKPYVVLEGHADTAMAQVLNTPEGKADKKICLYAGSLRKIYGIGNLVNGFIQANVPNTELHVYGNGDFATELTELTKQYPQIKYHGVAPNAEIVKAELAATLLVNPRPTGEDYTKYSFPSKNMEYMASGTPILTTKLPGMPADHLPHVYLIEEETADGIAAALRDLLTRDAAELHAKGTAAKAFILEEKNNVKQAEKLLSLLDTLCKSKPLR